MPWYGYALLTALTIALVGLLQKRTLQNEHSAEYGMIFSLLKVGMFFVFMRNVVWVVSAHQFILLVTTGTLAALAFFFVSKALRRLDLSTVAPVLSLDSGLSSILAFLFLGEHLSGQRIFGLSLLLVGTYVLELRHQPKVVGPRTLPSAKVIFSPFVLLWSTPGGIFALLSMTFFALSAVVDRAVLHTVSPTTYLAYVLPTIAVVSMIIFISAKSRLEILRARSGVVIFSIALAAGLHLVSNITQAHATALMAVGLVLALKRLSGLADVLLSGRLFHEKGILQKSLASLIMLIGVFFVVT